MSLEERVRVDDEDILVRPKTRSRSSFEWFGIITLSVVIGSLATDGIRLIAANAWANYQLEKMAKASREAQHRAKAEVERANEAREEQIRQRGYEDRFNSNECRFWRDVNAQNPSNKSRQGLATHCP